MKKKMTVSPNKEVELRKSFEFGAYLMISHYLVKTHGMNELERFGRFWGETGASGRKGLVARYMQGFLETEAKIERVWVGREVKKLIAEGYVGLVRKCPIRLMSNQHREDLPINYFCDHTCSIMYPYAYRLLGFESSIEKLDQGCGLVIQS